jgi:hypothetical protein
MNMRFSWHNSTKDRLLIKEGLTVGLYRNPTAPREQPTNYSATVLKKKLFTGGWCVFLADMISMGTSRRVVASGFAFSEAPDDEQQR